MNHLRIVGYIGAFALLFVLLFIVVPTLMTAKSTVAVVAGFAIVIAILYFVGAYIHSVYQELTKPKENK
jgi:hypothetical protein